MRPSLVVSGQAFTEQTGQIIICAVSSKPPRNQFEVSLQGWQDAGLRFPSKVQAGKLLTVDARLVKKLGHLLDSDLERVKEALRRAIL